MGRPSDLERMSYAELTELESRISRLKVQKQNEARASLRNQMSAMAMQHVGIRFARSLRDVALRREIA